MCHASDCISSRAKAQAFLHVGTGQGSAYKWVLTRAGTELPHIGWWTHPLHSQKDDSCVDDAHRAQHGHKRSRQPCRALADVDGHAGHPAY